MKSDVMGLFVCLTSPEVDKKKVWTFQENNGGIFSMLDDADQEQGWINRQVTT